MSLDDLERRRRARPRDDQSRDRRVRVAAAGSIAMVAAIVIALAVSELGGGSSSHRPTQAAPAHRTASAKAPSGSGAAAGKPGPAAVPVLAYGVIAAPPPGAGSPDNYVPVDEFAAQMQALKAAGWRAVTLNQLEAYWTRGVSLGTGKPIVLTFDTGYRSQYTNALPVLQKLGWVGDENLRVNGLPPDQGGLTDAQIRGLLAAGWELDTLGLNDTDLLTVGSTQVQSEVLGARQLLRQRYGVPVNWFSYPAGHYDATVIPQVRAAGYLGSTTSVPGWATPTEDRYRLPRLRVLPGTSGSSLLAQIASAKDDPPPPDSSAG